MHRTRLNVNVFIRLQKKTLLIYCVLNWTHKPGFGVIQEKYTDKSTEGRMSSLYLM